MDNKLTWESKIVFINREENKLDRYLDNQTIEWYLDQMSITTNKDHLLVREWFFLDLDKDWKVKSVISAIMSWLMWVHEYDDLFYTIKDNTIYIDRLKIKDIVR